MSIAFTRMSFAYGLPFFMMQVAAVAGLFVFPISPEALVLVGVTYLVRMFGITAGFHRYFSHRGFKTGRFFQFALAYLGSCTAQRGVLWWSGHHIEHHRHSDTDRDIHSPKKSWLWAHLGWLLDPSYAATPARQLRAFSMFPELIWLDRNWLVPPVSMAFILFCLGGWTWLYWGFFVSTFLTWHCTFSINSLAHIWGRRRYSTKDTSRNNFWLALLTLGEGWHNNHHHYPSTANNGFFWWEVDMTYVILRLLEKVGVVWGLRTPPAWVLEGKARKQDFAPTALASKLSCVSMRLSPPDSLSNDPQLVAKS